MSTYTDLNPSFRTSIKENNSLNYDLNSVKKALLRLFSTGKGDVPFNRNYGTSLKTLLFENNLHPSDVIMFLYMDITDWEPRVTLSPADINIVRIDNHSYKVSCNFRVPGLNNVSSGVESIVSR